MAQFSLEQLAETIAARAASGDPGSYTATLLGRGVGHCAKKLGEEAVETVIAAVEGDGEALAAEAADLLYHLLVVLHLRGVPFRSVLAELARRTAQSGLAEKASRPDA